MDSFNGEVKTEGRDLATVEPLLAPLSAHVPDPHDAQLLLLRMQRDERIRRIRELQARGFEIQARIDTMQGERADLEITLRAEVAMFTLETQILENLGAIEKVAT